MNKELSACLTKLNKKFPTGIYSTAEEIATQEKRINFDGPLLTYLYSGFKCNSIHHLIGQPSGGKSTLATYIASQCQKREPDPEKRYVLYMDYERSFEVEHARQMGMDVDKLIVLRPHSIEEGTEQYEQLIQTGSICCTILDSDSAAPSRNELVDEVGKPNFGSQAKALGACMKRFNIYSSEQRSPIVIISQERANMCVSLSTKVDFCRFE